MSPDQSKWTTFPAWNWIQALRLFSHSVVLSRVTTTRESF
jgi:hypothetical protein